MDLILLQIAFKLVLSMKVNLSVESVDIADANNLRSTDLLIHILLLDILILFYTGF